MSIPPFSNTPPESIPGTNQQNAGQGQPRSYISFALDALLRVGRSFFAQQEPSERAIQRAPEFPMPSHSGQVPISSSHSISHERDPVQQLQLELQAWVNAAQGREHSDRRIASRTILASYELNSPELNLRRLRLSSLPESIGNLSALQRLNLDDTQIASLPESIGNLSALQRLDLRHTRIASLPASIGSLKELISLDLSHSRIQELPLGILDLPRSCSIDLIGCAHLSATVRELLRDATSSPRYNGPRLRYSIPQVSSSHSIAHQKLQLELRAWVVTSPDQIETRDRQIAAEKILICYERNLPELNLQGLRLSSLPESIGKLPALQCIDLDDTQIASLPESIGDLSALRHLYLNGTRIASLPESIGDLSALEDLHLSATPIASLPESIGNLSALQDLYLVGTRIASLPESIVDLGELISLDLSYSRIRGLPLEILDLPNTCTIDLTGCPFSEPVLERLRNAVSSHGYEGPTLSYSMPQERIFAEKPLEEILAEVCTIAHVSLPDLGNFNNNQKRNLAVWLSKLSWTADWKQEEARFALCQRAVTFLQHAKDDASFAEIFFPIIEEAVTTCGDRVALSLIDLSLAYETDAVARTDLNSLSQFLLKRVWPIEQLKKIAANKVPALRFFDEIEVYLGYLIRVGKERLDLDLGVQGMLYFGCAGLTEGDINKAHAKVKKTLENPIEQAKFLAGNGHWQKMVSTLMPAEYNRALEQDNPRLALISLASNLIQENNNQ